MHLTLVYDNNPLEPGLKTTWGFACVAKVGKTTLLFDTGGDGAILLENMKPLGVAPNDVELVLISHLHHDHFGALDEFLEKKLQVQVYIPQSFPEEIDGEIETAGASPIRVDSFKELRTNVFTLGEFGGAIRR